MTLCYGQAIFRLVRVAWFYDVDWEAVWEVYELHSGPY